jgi:hypothetical protein
MRFVSFALILFGGLSAQAQVRTYNACTGADSQRADLDTFCPRLEGVHTQGCCPPIFNYQSPLLCQYYRGSSEVVQQDSTFIRCNSNTNQNEIVACCASYTQSCGADEITVNFYPRLINRANTCCFESCPNAQYWMNAPSDPRFQSDHILGTTNSCSAVPINTCSAGLPPCEANVPCPPDGTPIPTTDVPPTLPPPTLPPQTTPPST